VRQPADRIEPNPKPRAKRSSGFQPAPPWAPFPRDLHLAWVNGIATALALAVLVLSLLVFASTLVDERRFAVVPLIVALAALGGLLLAYRALWRHLDRADTVMRFFDWAEWSLEEETRAADAKKKGKARAKVRAKPSAGADEGEPRGDGKDDGDDAEPSDPAFWVEKLAERLARMQKFVELNAPELVVEQERQLIRRAIEKLPPAQALSVMRGWPKLREQFARADRDSEPPPSAPNATRN
jgi:hypothetical protein